MPVYSKQILSGSVDGVPIRITATSQGNAQEVHRVQATSTAAIESLWLWASSRSDGGIVGQFEFISATATNTMPFTLEQFDNTDFLDNQTAMFQGLPMTGTDTVIQAWNATSTTGIMNMTGYVHLIATG